MEKDVGDQNQRVKLSLSMHSWLQTNPDAWRQIQISKLVTNVCNRFEPQAAAAAPAGRSGFRVSGGPEP
eukprot:755381-Hanusia_phi.AAC.1